MSWWHSFPETRPMKEWGRGGVLRYDGYEYYMIYDPKLYYPACVKKADAAFVKEQNDYLAEQRRIKAAKEKRELERVERWKKLEAKYKAEDALFFMQYGITIAEAAQGKAPKFYHVNGVVSKLPEHEDNVQIEANTMAVPFVDDVVVDTEVDLIDADVSPIEVEVPTYDVVNEFTVENDISAVPIYDPVIEEIVTEEEVRDFNITDDLADALVYDKVVDTKLVPMVDAEVVHVDHVPMAALLDLPLAHTTESLDTPNTAPIMLLDHLDIVVNGDILQHTFADPYLAHVDMSPDLHLSNYLVSGHGVILNYVQPRGCFGILLVQHGAHNPNAHKFKMFVRILFDPGIILGFLLKFHGVKIADADFYDIMLIRGRIIFSREGMIRTNM